MRANYTWHLRPPFRDEFDHTHWWDQSDVDPKAALYELARRHPLVGKVRASTRRAAWYGQELRAPHSDAALEKSVSQAVEDLWKQPEAIRCLCLIGLKPWSKLSLRERQFWWRSAGNLKGVDSRDDSERCGSVTLSALQKIRIELAVKLGRKANAMTKKQLADLLLKETKSPRWSAAICREAVVADDKGYWLIAVAPDLDESEAKTLLSKTYRSHRVLYPAAKQRARPMNWLALISEFENVEVSSNKTRSKAFTGYRRAQDLIRFPTSGLRPPLRSLVG